MNDFKIVKCKKCDAALVETMDKTLDQCIQCGYKFNPIKNTKVIDKEQVTKHATNLKATPELSQLIRKIRNAIVKKTSGTPVKKKFAIITIIKWYIIIALVLGFLSSILSH